MQEAIPYIARPIAGSPCRTGTADYVSVLDSGVVKVIDRASLSVVNTIRLPGWTLALPRDIAFSIAGETAVITDEHNFVHFVR